jgi:signal transduction histidine kinase
MSTGALQNDRGGQTADDAVLVVDDEPMVVESLALLLSAEWRVLTATSAAQAQRLLDAERVAVLISDERMPGTSGVELLQWTSERHPAVVRILLTGNADFSTLVAAINAGRVWHFVRKPWDNLELRNITRRAVEHRAQSLQVERVERRLATLMNATQLGVVRCALDGTVLEDNGAFRRMAGARDPERRTNLAACLRDRAGWDMLVAHLRSARVARDVDFAVDLPRGGVAHLRLDASLVREGHGWFIEASVRDVSDTISAEVQRRELAERSARIQRMETVAMLGSGAVHDLNNLLTVVLGNVSILGLDGVDDVERSERLSEVASAAERAGAITRQLVGLLRGGEAARVGSSNVTALVHEALKLLRRGRREVRFETHLEASLPPVRVDNGQLFQTLMNLMVNACDAMPGGGTLTVRADVLRGFARDDLSAGDYVRIRVADTGHGIAPDVLPRIFEPLFTTKAAGPASGSGIGLAVVQSFVRQSGGAVDVESESGVGSEFSVLLPCEASPHGLDASRAGPSAGTSCVLIVEDESALAAQAARFLRERGLRVLTAADGPQALEIARANPDIHAAVVDLVLPAMGGDEVVEALREILPSPRLVIVTGFEVPPDREAALRRGDVTLLRKPYALERVWELVSSGPSAG